MNPSRCFFVLLFGCALFFLEGCSSFSVDPEAEENWVIYQLEGGPPRRDLLSSCRWAIHRAELPPGETDLVAGWVKSGWDISLAPYSKQGTRTQATIEVTGLEGHNNYEIRIQVLVQTNQEIHHTLELSAAEWENSGFDRVRARVILQHLLLQVKPGTYGSEG